MAAVALWVRSHFVQDEWNFFGSHAADGRYFEAEHHVYSVSGQLIWKIETRDRPQGFEAMVRLSKSYQPPAAFSHRRRPTDEFSFNPALRNDPSWVRAGFRYSRSLHPRAGGELMAVLRVKPEQAFMTTVFTEVGSPHWLMPAIAAPLPLAMAWRWWRRRRRTGAGLCPSCGYDIRATPGRCPECGREASSVG